MSRPVAAWHPWSAWRPLPDGLMERRCPCCGSVERAEAEELLAGELERLRAVLAAWRRAFPHREPGP